MTTGTWTLAHLTGIADADMAGAGYGARVRARLADLGQHIEREELGVFPVAVVTVGAAGWETVDKAHATTPTFIAQATATPETDS